MEEQSFKGIITRFSYVLVWCFGLGIIMGLLHRLPYPNLHNTIIGIITENSAPKSFHNIAVASIISLGVFITFFGRTKEKISRIRYIIGYKSAEIALTLAAVFFGLLFGFSLALLQWPLFGATFLAFLFSAGALILLLWLSFANNYTQNERMAKCFSIGIVVISIGVVGWTYS